MSLIQSWAGNINGVGLHDRTTARVAGLYCHSRASTACLCPYPARPDPIRTTSASAGTCTDSKVLDILRSLPAVLPVYQALPHRTTTEIVAVLVVSVRKAVDLIPGPAKTPGSPSTTIRLTRRPPRCRASSSKAAAAVSRSLQLAKDKQGEPAPPLHFPQPRRPLRLRSSPHRCLHRRRF